MQLVLFVLWFNENNNAVIFMTKIDQHTVINLDRKVALGGNNRLPQKESCCSLGDNASCLLWNYANAKRSFPSFP